MQCVNTKFKEIYLKKLRERALYRLSRVNSATPAVSGYTCDGSTSAFHGSNGSARERDLVEASNVINVPKCNKGPKCNKNLVLNVIKVLNVIRIGS